jgi:LmbE family N-acetylglucosaminyl deacetylase
LKFGVELLQKALYPLPFSHYPKYMKQVYIGIFAHPDDESFGPSGTLALKIKDGGDVHLICATAGQNGSNPDDHENLGDIRNEEWLAAGKLLGAKTQHQLWYLDGELNNHYFRQIADDCSALIESIVQEYGPKTEFTFVTMDKNGISGHIDHIVMSLVSNFVFVRMRKSDARLKALHFFCVNDILIPKTDTSFVFMPKGRGAKEIDITVDISEVFELKKQIMRAHVSQRADAEWLIERAESAHTLEEHFITYKD